MNLKKLLSIKEKDLMSHQMMDLVTRDALMIFCLVGILGIVIGMMLTLYISLTPLVAAIQLLTGLFYVVIIVLIRRNMFLKLLPIVMVAYHFVWFGVLWYSSTLSGNIVMIFAIYTMMMIIVLTEGVKRRITYVVFTLMLLSMLSIDLSAINDDIAKTAYLNIVFGSSIVGILLLTIIEQYKRQLVNSRVILYEYAFKDSLTGAYNVRYLNEQIKQSSDLWLKEQENYAVAMIDIDDFKKVNDTYGHNTGDAVLIHLVDRILDEIHEEDVLFRYGGDEFVLFMKDMNAQEASLMMKKIVQMVSDETISDDAIKIKISVGLSDIKEASEKSLDIFELADNRLYLAKSSGKNQVCYQSQ